MYKDFKNRLAALLRRWANRLAPVATKPSITLNKTDLTRYRLIKRVNLDDINSRVLFRNMSAERVREILAQETIVEAAHEMAKLLTVEETRKPYERPQLTIEGEFYFNERV